MPRRTQEQDQKPFEYRPGLGFQRFRGMNRSADPASIPPDQFHLLTNVRLTPAGMISRDGLVEQDDTGNPACITGMIDFNDVGVGLWLFEGHDEDDTAAKLGNFNEMAAQPYTLHWHNDEFNPESSDKDQFYHPSNTWNALIRWRGKLLAVGAMALPDESDESQNLSKRSLVEIALPTESGDDANHRWLVNLSEDTLVDEFEIGSMVTRLDRADEATTGGVLRETIYIGTQDGRIVSYDGQVVVEEHDMGGAYTVRLITHNEVGIFAIGSNGSAAVARYQSEPGGSWDTVTLPETDMAVTDLVSWGGKVYVIDLQDPGPITRGARLYAYTTGAGSLGAHVFEWPFTSTTDGNIEAGTFFSYRGSLYAVSVLHTGFTVLDWKVWRRDTDSSWTDRFIIRTESDSESFVTWFDIAGNRAIFGGKKGPSGHTITEVNMGTGALNDLHTAVSEDAETITVEAFLHSPDDFSLGEEEG